MKKLLLFFAILITCSTICGAKEKDEEKLSYQIEGAGTGTAGSDRIKITVLHKKKDKVTDDLLGKAAVHGVLFRGYTNNKSSGFGDGSDHRAMMGSGAAEIQHKDYFDSFFNDGTYMSYVQIVDETRRVVKSGKLYKVSSVVTVSTAQLRNDLQKAGILKGLNSGW